MSRSSTPLSALTVILVLSCSGGSASADCFQAIFGFGASKVDTGNFIRTPYLYRSDQSTHYPYGRTYFHHTTGRYSDGRLTVDFFAEALGLPLLRPYLAGVGGVKEFGRGVNFAVAGGTAIDSEFYEKRNISILHPYSLSVQVGWFEGLLSSLCPSGSACKDIVAKALFLVGEVGGNDYNYQYLYQENPEGDIKTIIPLVVQKTSSAITDLIGLGAKTLLVPGNYPMGCVSTYLSIFQTNKSEDYEPGTGCIKWLNVFSEHHNYQLQIELEKLRKLHPDTTIIYADYYNPLISIFHAPQYYGFTETALDNCCGGEGPYNVNPTVRCGDRGAVVCGVNSKHVNWDGVHLTEAANKITAQWLLNGPLSSLPIGKNCLLHRPHQRITYLRDQLMIV